MARCPNGTRKNSKRECVKKGEPIRCKNGTRKNSKGNCVSTRKQKRKAILETLAFYGTSPFKTASKFMRKTPKKLSSSFSFKTASQKLPKKAKVGFGSERTW
jgi:hypothetical protein